MDQSDKKAAWGYCKMCDTVHSITEGYARSYCYDLMDILDKEKRLDFDIPIKQANPLFTTDSLWGDLRGKMFGILDCIDTDGNHVQLKAFSCQHNGEWEVPGWAPPLVDSVAYLKRVREGAVTIKEIGTEMEKHKKGNKEWQSLKVKRKKFSQDLMIELHEMYELHNFNEKVVSLNEAFFENKGIPTGTGDCCAPKLLNWAAQKGLKPVGLAEFFYGRENSSGTKKHKQFYTACDIRCQPILGFLLCGADNV